MEGVTGATGEINFGVYVTNDNQSNSVATERRPIQKLNISRNQIGHELWHKTGYSRGVFPRGIVLDGMNGGIQHCIIEDNIMYVRMGTNPTWPGSGAISLSGTTSDGGCTRISLGGNQILQTSAEATDKYGIDIGAYSTYITNTKPNYIEGAAYGVVTSATGCSNLHYLDDQVIYNPGTANYLFNTQLTKAYHRTDRGTTANRPGSTSNRTTYTTYYDTTETQAIWWNGSAWVDSFGGTPGTSYVDTTGYGNSTFTGTRNFEVSDVEVFGLQSKINE